MCQRKQISFRTLLFIYSINITNNTIGFRLRQSKGLFCDVDWKLISWFVKSYKQPTEVCFKKGVFKNLIQFAGKHLCWELFFKSCSLTPTVLLRKRLRHRCFPANFAKTHYFISNTITVTALNYGHLWFFQKCVRCRELFAIGR